VVSKNCKKSKNNANNNNNSEQKNPLDDLLKAKTDYMRLGKLNKQKMHP
jgi:hypothetical protein